MTTTTITPGERFAAAVAAKDATTLRAMLSDDVDFRAMTPGRFWEMRSSTEVVEVFFGKWFEPSDQIVSLDQVEVDAFADCQRVSYRCRVVNPDGAFAVEQQAYFTTNGGRIGWMRVMCSGFRRVSPATPL